MIKKVTQVVDKKGRLKNNKCPKCGQNVMYFNFHNALICRNCSYMPSCQTCKRYYIMEDIFKGEKGIEYMKKSNEYKDTKEALQYLIGQLARVIGSDGSSCHPKSKAELIFDIDRFLKGYNNHHNLGISRYTDKIETKEDRERTIKHKNKKIKDLKRDAQFHREWHKDRIKDLLEEISKLKQKE